MSKGAGVIKPAFEPKSITLRDGRAVVIRAGVPDDAPALIAYMRRCLPDFSPFVAMDVDEFTMTEESERQWLSQQQAAPGALVVLAFDGERIVGILNCSCSPRRRISHIGHIGMSSDKAYWGSGLGGALMGAMIGWAVSHPVLELLELDVFADNVRAVRLYERAGFVKVGTVPRRAKFADATRKDGVFMYRRVDGLATYE